MQLTPSKVPRLSTCIFLTVLGFVFAEGTGGEQENGEPGTPDLSSYIRVGKPEDHLYCLETAVRLFVPKSEEGPEISLVAVVHMGSEGYYRNVQEILDSKDLVFYEGVKAADSPGTQKTRVSCTRLRIRFIRILAERYRMCFDRYPRSLDELRKVVGRRRKDLTGRLRQSLKDGWGRAVKYVSGEKSVTILSYGADGKKGGKGDDADIEARQTIDAADVDESDPPSDSPAWMLAGALGLKYQMEGINYDRDHFRNSDVSIEWVRLRLEDNSAFKNLEAFVGGEGWRGVLLAVMLKIVTASPSTASAVKLVMLEMFAGMKEIPAADPATKEMMEVILEGRNKVVEKDLQKAVRQSGGEKSIAVFYGAAHMADLEKHLTTELGYRSEKVTWLTAFSMDTEKEGVSPVTARIIRWTVRQQLENR